MGNSILLSRILLLRIFLLAGWLCAAQSCFAMQSQPRVSAKKALAAKAVHARTSHKPIPRKQAAAPEAKARAAQVVARPGESAVGVSPANKPKRDFWEKCIACFCCDACCVDEELEAERLARQKALRKRRARPQPESHLFDDAGLVLAIM